MGQLVFHAILFSAVKSAKKRKIYSATVLSQEGEIQKKHKGKKKNVKNGRKKGGKRAAQKKGRALVGGRKKKKNGKQQKASCVFVCVLVLTLALLYSYPYPSQPPPSPQSLSPPTNVLWCFERKKKVLYFFPPSCFYSSILLSFLTSTLSGLNAEA